MKLFHDVSTVETPEQLEISLPLAGIGTRFLAYAIDFLCQLVIIVVAFILVITFTSFADSALRGTSANQLEGFQLLVLALLSAILFAVNFLYFAIFELIWQGQSPGKRSLGLRVVRDGGFPVDGRATLIRNLLRTVDFLPAFYVVGVFSIFIGRHGKRIGDYAAGTVVIRERKADKVAYADPKPKASGALAPTEAALVEQFFERMLEFEPEARTRVARDLANRLAAKYGKPPPEDSMKFLSSFLKDETH